MKKTNRKGFTLVEIMIVVVIIGLLAAMAIPAFQKVRQSSIEKTVVNDGKLLAHAAAQYFMEHGVNSITFGIADGSITGPLSAWVSQPSRGVVTANQTINASSLSTTAFTLSHANLNAAIGFDSEGKKQNP
jgi:type IV pilus assembly protein PilA